MSYWTCSITHPSFITPVPHLHPTPLSFTPNHGSIAYPPFPNPTSQPIPNLHSSPPFHPSPPSLTLSSTSILHPYPSSRPPPSSFWWFRSASAGDMGDGRPVFIFCHDSFGTMAESWRVELYQRLRRATQVPGVRDEMRDGGEGWWLPVGDGAGACRALSTPAPGCAGS